MVLAHDISKGNRTNDVKITQNITFETMLLAPNTLEGLKDSGFHKPSPIQLYGIPIGKCGFDLLLEAKSGTGKTAVFTIIALEKLDFHKGLQVVILTPTREIAAQICDVLKQIGSRYQELKVEVVMGGLPLLDDVEKFKKPVHIVVGSPGRLRRLIQNKNIDVKSVRLLVLDEADKLMETSFQTDVKYIHASLPKQKQVIMSSATYPENSKDIINTYVQNASHVCPNSDCVLLGIEQKVTLVKYNSNIIRYTQDKFKELHKILGRLQFKQCLVFCNYQVRVTEVHNLLKKAEWPSEKLFGQQEQVERLDALKTLQQYKCRILVSTDLAARGIDASNIDLVVNFEPPYEWQTYLHRIGRAGRFGSYGLAITILGEGKEQQKFTEMFKSIQLSSKMRHLWSDEEFDINSSSSNTPLKLSNSPFDNPTTTDITQKVSSEDIWELLSNKSKANNSIITIESQSKLGEDFENPKIEPFSELMFSLDDKNSQEPNEDVVFKHIEMSKASSNNIIMSQNGTTEKNALHKNLEEHNNGNITYNTNGKINDLKEMSPVVSENINNGMDNTSIDIDKSNYQHDASKAMLDLDLPNMFSSKKNKTYDSKRKMNKKMAESSNHNRNKGIGVTYMPSLLQENEEILSVNGDIDNHPNNHTERDIYYKNRIKVNNHNEETHNHYEKEYKYDNPQKQNCSRSQNRRKFRLDSHFEQQDSAKLYCNWYYQLKMRMQHIQQAIYIDEITRL